MRAAALSLISLLALLEATAASAPPTRTAAEWVARARGLWRDLEYEQVVEAARWAQGEANATPADQVAALWLEGCALIVLGDSDAAESAFEKLLAVDPDFDAPEPTSPRVLAVFQPTRARWQVRQKQALLTRHGAEIAGIALAVAAPSRAMATEPIPITATLVDPAALVGSLTLHYRRKGQVHYASIRSPARPGRNVLLIPGALSLARAADTLEYFLEARHRSGVAVRAAGSAEQPFRLPLAPARPASRPLHRRWELWVGAAAVVAAAVVIPLAVVYGRELGVQQVVVRRDP